MASLYSFALKKLSAICREERRERVRNRPLLYPFAASHLDQDLGLLLLVRVPRVDGVVQTQPEVERLEGLGVLAVLDELLGAGGDAERLHLLVGQPLDLGVDRVDLLLRDGVLGAEVVGRRVLELDPAVVLDGVQELRHVHGHEAALRQLQLNLELGAHEREHHLLPEDVGLGPGSEHEVQEVQQPPVEGRPQVLVVLLEVLVAGPA